MDLLHEQVAVVVGVLLLGWLLGRMGASRRDTARSAQSLRDNRKLESLAERNRITAEELRERLADAQTVSAQLEKSLLELPEIAQRLSATRSLREIPNSCLDLVQEIYRPSYSVFYRRRQGEFVAVATRGETPYEQGHKVKAREGVVGWAAIRQMAVTGFEANGLDIDDDLENKAPDFSLCLPVVDGKDTLGVILIGPTERELPRGREVGRTIALITAVTIAHTEVLKEQERLAKTDGLTGLFNRTHVLKKLDLLVSTPNAVPRISLFLFDVDHFKHYNDTNGHLAGDDLLRGLAKLLDENVREGEFVGRYGGEEFLMVLPGAVGDDALIAADRIRGVIQDYVFENETAQPLGDLTVSGGVATWPVHGTSAAEVLHHADLALYAAKDGGRNRVLGYQPGMGDRGALPRPGNSGS